MRPFAIAGASSLASTDAEPVRFTTHGRRVAAVIAACGLGVLLQAYVGYQGRATGSPPAILFWSGTVLMYGATVVVVMVSKLSRAEHAIVVVVLAVSLQLTRLVLYPDMFVQHDELIHGRVLWDILHHHHLFTPNSSLPVTPSYPGLEIFSAGIAKLCGLSAHTSGSIVLVLARVIQALALFLVVDRIARSHCVATAASLIYIGNPQYLLFNSLFSYQSLALPLCFAFVYLVAKLGPVRPRVAWPVLAVATLAIASSHHLTSIGLGALLLAWLVAARYSGSRPRYLPAAVIVVLLIVTMWALLTGDAAGPYFSEILRNNFKSVQQLISGQSSHVFFKTTAGDATPVVERVLSFASVLILVTLLPIALWTARGWLLARRAPQLVLCLVAAAYPVIPLGHLTIVTSEPADRSSGFIFVAVSFLLAWWAFGRPSALVRAWNGNLGHRVGAALTIAVISVVLFIGGTVVGSGPAWLRAPGKSIVEGENRSVDAPALAAANWMAAHLTLNNRIYSDRTNALLASAVGHQHPVTSLADGIDNALVSRLLLAPPDSSDVRNARSARLQYLLVDLRLSTDLPHVGIYTDTDEFGGEKRTVPPPLSALTKFRRVTGSSLVYDNGALTLYYVGKLR